MTNKQQQDTSATTAPSVCMLSEAGLCSMAPLSQHPALVLSVFIQECKALRVAEHL